MNIHEYQAKDLLAAYGVPTPTGYAGLHGRRGRRGGQEAAGASLGGEGADPRRRPRQGQVQGEGGRRKGGVRLAKSIDEVKTLRRADAGQHARHHPDRPGRPRRQPPLYRGRRRHRARALSLRARRPRHLARRLHRLDRRRHGHRGGGARHAREDPHHDDRSGDRAPAVPRPQDRLRARPQGRSGQAVREADRRPLPHGRREGHEPARDQSAGRHQGRQAASASTPR